MAELGPDLLKLIDDYGDASFNCGTWRADEAEVPYDPLWEKQQTARRALRLAIESLVKTDA
jgi:hypothetical protein